MSTTVLSETSSRSSDRRARPRKPRSNELADFRTWLASLGFQSLPKVHINGVQHPTAVVVVDFGTPLGDSARLSTEQSADLISHLRATTKALYPNEIIVRVQNDSATGIWWSGVG